MANFKISSFPIQPRTELHDTLNLTGSEVSINRLPAGVAVPFVHAHTHNEELYIVIEGRGQLFIDGEVHDIKARDAFRIDPDGARAIRASDKEGITYICIQTKAGSLEGFTASDGRILEEKAPWHQQEA